MDEWNTMRAQLKRLMARLYTRRNYILAAVLLVVSLVCVCMIPAKRPELHRGTLSFRHIGQTVLGSNQVLYVNDEGLRVTAMTQDGALLYEIDAAKSNKNAHISNIAVDENGNLYVYTSILSPGSSNSACDFINMYDEQGSFLRQLYYHDNSTEEAEESHISNLYVHSGTLQFTTYLQYSNVYYSIDIKTGELTRLYSQYFSQPYFYQWIYLTAHHGYYYIKIDGEIGYGIIGKSESALYNYTFNTDANGAHADTLVPLEGVYYCYDSHNDTLFQLNNLNGFSKAFSEKSPLAKQTLTSLDSASGMLCGSTENTAWYMDFDGEVHCYDQVSLSTAQYFCALFLLLARVFGQLLLVLLALYAAGFVLSVFVGPKTSIFYKLLFILPLMLTVVCYLLFSVFQFYQDDYANRDYQRIARNVQIVADNIDGSLLVDATSSDFFQSDAYKALSDNLAETFSDHSDVYAQILVQGKTGAYVYADTSNTGKLMSLHTCEEPFSSPEEIVQQKTDPSLGVAMLRSNISCDFYAPIYGSSHIVTGYLFASTPVEHETTIFWNTIQKLMPTLVSSLSLLTFVLLLMAMLISTNAAKASQTITEISAGNLNARVQRIGNDEIGDISRCVNTMAENLQLSLQRNRELTQEMRMAQVEVVATFAEITEAKSGQTGQHVRRVSEYTKLLAYIAGYNAEEVERIGIASMMHDVGKLLISADILEKPDKLTQEEFNEIKRHCEYGERLLHNAPGQIMQYARTIALEHHERYDGTGYPAGKAGSAINPVSRMVSIADVFDALVSKRSYKDKWEPDDAFAEIQRQSGKQFDPYFVRLFLEHKNQVMAIYFSLPDTETPLPTELI